MFGNSVLTKFFKFMLLLKYNAFIHLIISEISLTSKFGLIPYWYPPKVGIALGPILI
jgi:hypothetical protein